MTIPDPGRPPLGGDPPRLRLRSFRTTAVRRVCFRFLADHGDHGVVDSRRQFHARRQRDVLYVQRVADTKFGNVQLQGVRDRPRQAEHFDFALDDLHHAAELFALGLALRHDRHPHPQLAVHVDLVEIDVQEPPRHRVRLEFLDDGRLGKRCTVLDAEREDRPPDVALLNGALELANVDRQHDRLSVGTVKHGREHAFPAQATGRSVARGRADGGAQFILFQRVFLLDSKVKPFPKAWFR